jgi:hypothetical protein
MILADVVAVIASLVGLLLAVPATFLVARALLPRVSRQAQLRFERTPLLAFFVGIPLLLPLLVPALVLLNVAPGPGKAAGVLWLGVFLGTALVGCGGLAAHIGTALRGPADRDRPWLGTVKGGVALVLAAGVPVLGWFLILPVALIAGTGSTALAVIFRLKEDGAARAPRVEDVPTSQVA